MITPRFELSQDADFVHVHIRMPHLRAEDGEFYVDGSEFKFYLRPYFLRLTFRQKLVEDGREGASYDVGTGVLSVRLPKEVAGETFSGLSMLSELLRKPSEAPEEGGTGGGRRAGGPLIEVLSSSPAAGGAGDGEEKDLDEDDEMWAGVDPNEYLAMEAEADQALPSLETSVGVRYGFNDAYSGLFSGLEYEGLLQLPDPETATPASRRSQRLVAEAEAFDCDHYIADFAEGSTGGGLVQAALGFVPWWSEPAAQAMREEEGAREGGAAADFSDGSTSAWGEEEREQLLRLPRKELLMGREESGRALCGLVDLLFSYCYDVRTTEGEHTCESGWTVRTLSTQLSWLDTPRTPAEAASACVRRSLCYPMCRHWRLASAALADVVALLRLGRRAVLRALLCLHRLVLGCDYGYLLNRCCVDEFCLWVQQAPARRLARLADALDAAAPAKEHIGWPLAEYETLALEGGREDEEDEESGESEDEGRARVAEAGPLVVELGGGTAANASGGAASGMDVEGGGTLV